MNSIISRKRDAVCTMCINPGNNIIAKERACNREERMPHYTLPSRATFGADFLPNVP